MAQSESIWDFACRYYVQDGVKAACLTAQDRFGLPVTSLIFALYCVRYGLKVDFEAARVLGAELSAQKVVPLRTARQSLPASSASRAESLAAELEAERSVLEALVDLAVRRAEAYRDDVALKSPSPPSFLVWGRVGMGGGEARALPETKRLLRSPPSPDLFPTKGKKGGKRRTFHSHPSALLAMAGLEQLACDSDLLDVLKTLAVAAQKM